MKECSDTRFRNKIPQNQLQELTKTEVNLHILGLKKIRLADFRSRSRDVSMWRRDTV